MDQVTKKRFYFIRHGKTDWNNKNLCQGQIDIPLNQAGRDEIIRICPLISSLNFVKIVSSPLMRALESARIIQHYCSKPLEIIDEIKERGWGAMEGASSAKMYQIEEQEEKNAQFIPSYNIELRSSFKSRIIQGLNDALSDDTPLVVSHGRVFLVLSEILEIPLVRQIPNATVVECIPDNDCWNIKIHKG